LNVNQHAVMPPILVNNGAEICHYHYPPAWDRYPQIRVAAGLTTFSQGIKSYRRSGYMADIPVILQVAGTLAILGLSLGLAPNGASASAVQICSCRFVLAYPSHLLE
jgi:hypothetical protein